MNLLQKLTLILLLLFVFLLVYSPHFSYKYPLHVDEYHHIAKAINFIENKELNIVPNYQHQPYSPNLEPGFTIFLSLLAFAKLDLILFYKFLPAIFAALAAFTLFHLMFYITKNFYLAISSIVFFASLKSNINLHGLWFFTPLTLAMPLIFLFFLLFLTPNWVFYLFFTEKFAQTALITKSLTWPYIIYTFLNLPVLFLLYTVKKPAYILIANLAIFVIVSFGCYYLIPTIRLAGPPYALALSFFIGLIVLGVTSFIEYRKLPSKI